MEAPVEVRYSGVILGHINELPSPDSQVAFFLPMREPMPVGTVLRLRLEDRETPVRVIRTIESPDPNLAGMQVRPVGDSEIVAFEFIPDPVPMLEQPLIAEMETPEVYIDPKKSAAPDSATAAAQAKVVHLEADEPPAAVVEVAEGATASDPGATASVESPAAAASTTAAEAVPEAVPVAVGSSMTGALENATGASATESAAVNSEATGESSAASTSEDLPPARPISGGSGRRKTKRRK